MAKKHKLHLDISEPNIANLAQQQTHSKTKISLGSDGIFPLKLIFISLLLCLCGYMCILILCLEIL